MADVPEDLLEQINELERLFRVDQQKLKDITEHFVKELAKGMLYTTATTRINFNIMQASRSKAVALYVAASPKRLCWLLL